MREITLYLKHTTCWKFANVTCLKKKSWYIHRTFKFLKIFYYYTGFNDHFPIKTKSIPKCISAKYAFLIGHAILSYTAIDNGWRALGKKKLKMDNEMWERAFREMGEIRRLLASEEKRRPLRMPDGIQVRKKQKTGKFKFYIGSNRAKTNKSVVHKFYRLNYQLTSMM